MKCPNCTIEFHAGFCSDMMEQPNEAGLAWSYKYTVCPSCRESIIVIGLAEPAPPEYDRLDFLDENLVYPFHIQRIKIPAAVPEYVRNDYREACGILNHSPKASAAMARRVLQSILRDQGYTQYKLNCQIEAVLSESDTDKSLPRVLKRRIDVIRNVGNMSAHLFEAKDESGIIEVSLSDADLCLDIVGEVITHYYADDTEVERRIATIDEKLDRAGKDRIKRKSSGE